MQRRSRLWRGLALLLSCILVSCGLLIYSRIQKKADADNTRFTIRRENNPANFRAIDSAIHLLKDGDLALRTGADATSVMLRQMNLTNKTYSHCGIVMIEGGYPFIYHSIGGEDNPDSRLRRDSAIVFFTPVSNERLGAARLDISKPDVDKLRQITQRYWKAGVPFDLDFDLVSDDKLYCAEFVYKAVQEATGNRSYFHITHLLKRTYVGVDNLYEAPHARIICDVRYKL